MTVDKDGNVTTPAVYNGDGTTTTETVDKDGNTTKETTDENDNIVEVEAGGTTGGEDGVKVEAGEGGEIVKKDDGTYEVTGPATITLPTEPATTIEVAEGDTVTVDKEGNVIETKTEDGVKTETVTSKDGEKTETVEKPYDGGSIATTTDEEGNVKNEVFTPKNGGAKVESGEGGFIGWLDETLVAEKKAAPVTEIVLDAASGAVTITFKPALDAAHEAQFGGWYDAMQCAGRLQVKMSDDLSALEAAAPQKLGKVTIPVDGDTAAKTVIFTVEPSELETMANGAKNAFFRIVIE